MDPFASFGQLVQITMARLSAPLFALIRWAGSDTINHWNSCPRLSVADHCLVKRPP